MASAAAARNRSLGRPRDPPAGHYDPAARSSLDWSGGNTRRNRKRGPGDRNRHGGAILQIAADTREQWRIFYAHGDTTGFFVAL